MHCIFITKVSNVFAPQNLFSVIRSRAGCSDNPTVVQARAALRAITCNELIQSSSKSKNCETVSLEFLLPSLPVSCPPSRDSTDGNVEVLSDLRASEILLPESLAEHQPVEVSHDAYAYVAGYNIRRFVTCRQCIACLISPSVRTPFIKNKSFTNCTLYDPVPPVICEVEKMKCKVFSLLNDHVPHLVKLSCVLLSHPEISCLFNFDFVHEHCRNHVQQVLLASFCRFFIRVFCMRRTESIKTHRQQSLKKFKKLVQ